jgi:hypothetical protein
MPAATGTVHEGHARHDIAGHAPPDRRPIAAAHSLREVAGDGEGAAPHVPAGAGGHDRSQHDHTGHGHAHHGHAHHGDARHDHAAHDHAAHAHGHAGPDHDHAGHAPHRHGPDPATIPLGARHAHAAAPSLSLLRLSLGIRLAVALTLSVLIWAGVAWALS